jgi:hypothetical protein
MGYAFDSVTWSTKAADWGISMKPVMIRQNLVARNEITVLLAVSEMFVLNL